MGNVGDSRCIASINGVSEALSVDHKPGDMLERARIENAGGFVEFNRVNGNLALSRAVGDFAFKNNSSLPPEDQVFYYIRLIYVRINLFLNSLRCIDLFLFMNVL